MSGGVVYVGTGDGRLLAFAGTPTVPEFPGSLVFLTILGGVALAMAVDRRYEHERSV